MKLKKQINKKRRVAATGLKKGEAKRLDPSEVKEYERERVHYGNYIGKKWSPQSKT